MACSTVCTIGELNERITIQEDTNSTQDAFGAVEPSSWSAITDGTVCARVEYKGGSEKYEKAQHVASTTVNFTIRYRSDITAKMRVSYDSEIYDIEVINVLERKRWTELVCLKQDS